MQPTLILLGYLTLILFAITAISFAPWVPTKGRDIKRAIRLSGLKSGEVFYDLGCGDGRVVFEAAKTGANCIGIELFFPLYLIALVRKWIQKIITNLSSPTGSGIQEKGGIPLDSRFRGNDKIGERIIFKCKNLFYENLSNADVIFLFGTPQTLKKSLTEKFLREVKPSARIVSYVFPIEGWTPDIADKGENNAELSIFVYTLNNLK